MTDLLTSPDTMSHKTNYSSFREAKNLKQKGKFIDSNPQVKDGTIVFKILFRDLKLPK